ncbi:MgtC/SapB family protein [Pollutimonas bauzanensis]|uniref:MgtC/SapB family protein n=1 Tax=Pollutimonas bauzanensis TaxID=658167 RepID=UPI000932ABA0|nr:MgtC/SapB family protein [Pollutimonas bauzanensis]
MDTAISVWDTIVDEFSDIPDAAQATRIALRLAMAILLGAAIGYERELRGKAAGLRTHMLVSLGAAIFILAPMQRGMSVADASRVLQGIIAGIGFLGAGAIIKMSDHGRIKGLTTAASIWVAAAIGIAAGMGLEATAVVSTLAVLFILVVVRRLEDNIDRKEKSKGAASPRRPDQDGSG